MVVTRSRVSAGGGVGVVAAARALAALSGAAPVQLNSPAARNVESKTWASVRVARRANMQERSQLVCLRALAKGALNPGLAVRSLSYACDSG